MKKLILVTALMLPMMSYANSLCPKLGLLAESVMTTRQNGSPMSGLMNMATNPEGATKEEKAVVAAFKEMVILAYDEPQWRTNTSRENAVNEFRNTIELECYK